MSLQHHSNFSSCELFFEKIPGDISTSFSLRIVLFSHAALHSSDAICFSYVMSEVIPLEPKNPVLVQTYLNLSTHLMAFVIKGVCRGI